MDKDVSRAQIGVDYATAMDVGDRLRQLPTPYDALAEVRLRVVVEIGLEIAVACLAEEKGPAFEPEISRNPMPIRVYNSSRVSRMLTSRFLGVAQVFGE